MNSQEIDIDLTYMFSSYARLYKLESYQKIHDICFTRCKLSSKDYDDIIKKSSESSIVKASNLHDAFVRQSNAKSAFTLEDVSCYNNCISKISEGFIITKESFRKQEIEILKDQVPT